MTCLAIISGMAMAKTVKGVVLEKGTDEPVIGASVLVKGSQIGSSTNIDGEFSINAPETAKQLVVSYVGMNTETVDITEGIMKIYLTSSAQNLDEVIVVAYGAQKKSSITGAISQVKSEDLAKRPVSSAVAALEGSTSGVSVASSYGSPGSEPTIRIRGIGTVNGSSSPLYVIDGVPFGGNISDINPEDIESMSVLKDAASAALYGNRASNGVILITTKKAKSERTQFTFRTNQGIYQRGIPEYETVDAKGFMRVEYLNLYNQHFTGNNLDRRQAENVVSANQYANAEIVKRIGFNMWDTDGDIYDANGYLTTDKMRGTIGEDLDWYDQATKNGYRAEYLFTGSGATDKSDYYFSLGYLNEEGYIQNSGFERFSGRATVNIKPVKWFKAGLNLNATHQKYLNGKGNGDDENSYTNPFNYCRSIAPVFPVHAHDPQTGEYVTVNGERIYDVGYYTLTEADGSSNTISTRNQYVDRHVIYENELNRDNTVRNTMNGIAYGEFYLPFGFTFSLKGNLNTRNSEQISYSNKVIGDAKDIGRLSKTVYYYKNWTFMQQLRWNMTFNSKHMFEVLLGHENYSYHYDYTFSRKSDEKFANNYNLANFSTPNDNNGYRNSYKTESYLARVQYNFDDRYNLEASFRRDGSSRFSKESRWGNFGSVGANWVFSNEEFMKQFTWLNSGKLRASWGQVGNDAGSGYYAYMSLFATSSSGTNGGSPAYYMNQLPAVDLKWETGESWGIGLEARLFNRWNIELEYYDKRNKDLIFDVYNPISSGSLNNYPTESTITKNIGTISNRGIEINTDVDVWGNKDWNVNIAANLTTLSNKVIKMPEQNKDGIISGSQKIIEGRSRYSWWTYHYEGVDQMTGNALYELDLEKYYYNDADGNRVGGLLEDGSVNDAATALKTDEFTIINGKAYANNTTRGKRDWKGKALPSVYGSFTGNVRYKNLSVSAMFTYSLGGKVYDSTYSSLMGASSSPHSYHVDMLNSWYKIPEGMTETSPDRISKSIEPQANSDKYTPNYAGGDRWLTSRNYFSFKNLNIAYTLPKSLTRKFDIQNITVSFTGENLFTKAARKGLDPMMGMSGYTYNYIPTARVYTFGLSINL